MIAIARRYEVTISGFDISEDKVVEIVGKGSTPAIAYRNALKVLEAVITK